MLVRKRLLCTNCLLTFVQVCVFTAPLFSAFCALATYGFVNEIRGNGPGLVAATLISTVPSYISRSVAGSYDNEGVAIFALVFTFFLFIKVFWVHYHLLCELSMMCGIGSLLLWPLSPCFRSNSSMSCAILTWRIVDCSVIAKCIEYVAF